jgi:hypothetical protein
MSDMQIDKVSTNREPSQKGRPCEEGILGSHNDF